MTSTYQPYCSVTCAFIQRLTSIMYSSLLVPVVVELCGPEPLLRQLGLDTERIIVSFSLNGVNQISSPYVHSCMWCATFCNRFQTFELSATVSRPTVATPTYFRSRSTKTTLQVETKILIKKLSGRQWESNSQPSEQLNQTRKN